MFSLGGQDDYAFSPDGQEICYTSNHDKNPKPLPPTTISGSSRSGGHGLTWERATATRARFWPTKNITADNPASDSTPLYSPDGRYIAYRAQQRPGYESDRFRLMLYDRKTGEKKNLTEDFDRWVGSFAGRQTRSRIYFARGWRGSPDLRVLVSIGNVSKSHWTHRGRSSMTISL